jgi:glutathione S-transferase
VNGNATPAQLELIAKQEEIVGQFTSVIEKTLVGPFIAGTQTPMIADFMCYPELSQVESMGIFDFIKYPKVEAWLARMKQVPHHDEIQKDVNGLLETLHLKPVQP